MELNICLAPKEFENTRCVMALTATMHLMTLWIATTADRRCSGAKQPGKFHDGQMALRASMNTLYPRWGAALPSTPACTATTCTSLTAAIDRKAKMKIKTAIQRLHIEINKDEWSTADLLLKKYQRKFGNRRFNYIIRLMIKNGVWSSS